MALIPQTKLKKIIASLKYINDQNSQTIERIAQADESDDLLIDFTQAKIDVRKTRLTTEANVEAAKAVQMFRWLLGDLGVAIPAAFTDAEVDAIDPEIRQTDDGL